jgi:hypothetical protein
MTTAFDIEETGSGTNSDGPGLVRVLVAVLV